MRKLTLTTLFICAFIATNFAQVGIGTTSPNTSSILDLTSTSKAFIPPRMTTANRDLIANPIAGMVIFNTDSTCIEIYRGTSWFNVCTGKSSSSLPAIDGFTSSNQVAASNLIAYWPFDNTKAESKSGLTPTTNGGATSYTTGKIGGANGALAFNASNLVYPVIDTLNKPTTFAGGFTLTLWAKLPVQTLYTSVWQLNGNIGDIFGLIGLSHRKGADSTFDFDGVMTNVDAGGTHSTSFSTALEGAASGFKVGFTDWEFIVMSYDSTTKMINYYGNGVLKGSKSIGTIIQPGAKFELVTTNSNPGITTSQVSFGSLDVTPFFPNAGTAGYSIEDHADGWQEKYLKAGTVIDDTRLFNKTLTLQQISDLYQLGNQGR